MQEVDVITTSDEVDFVRTVNDYLKDGWRVSSTACGFANSENYDFCHCYQAILIKDEN